MKPTRVRYLVLGLISLGTVINYLDRSVLGIAAPFFGRELGIGTGAMGLVFSAFSWSYAAAQIPGGMLLDRFGSRAVYGCAVALWSLITMLQGAASGLVSLLGLRLGLGAAEAPSYPTNSRVVRTWFPQRERARANSAYAVGQYFGLAFLSPVLFWIARELGWRALFMIAGALGIAFAALWAAYYRDPRCNPRINQAELDYIEAGYIEAGYVEAGAAPGHAVAPAPFSWQAAARLLSKRQILGASIGQFASNSTLVFFLTWFPTYLTTERHLQIQTAGFFTVLPYAAASAGVLLGGWLSDRLVARMRSPSLGRKLPIIAGLLMAVSMMAANAVHSNAAVLAIMSFAFFGQGMCNLGWTVITDVAPQRYLGLTAGVFNLCANLAGIVTPLVIGAIVAATGTFYGALVYVSLVALAGVAAYAFVLGEVCPVELDMPGLQAETAA